MAKLPLSTSRSIQGVEAMEGNTTEIRNRYTLNTSMAKPRDKIYIILVDFAKLREAEVSCTMSVCQSVCACFRPHGTTRLPIESF
jgi:hypothetical protein